MEPWIPFFQSLIWPIFIALIIFFVRGWFIELLNVIKTRIETGSEISLGPAGFALGSGPKYDVPNEEGQKEVLEKAVEEIVQLDKKNELLPHKELSQSIYLIHTAHLVRQADPSDNQRDFYQIRVQLSSYIPTILDRVDKVIYYRHRSLKPEIREITDRQSNFEMRAKLWGQFNLRAEVYFKGSSQPLTLYRYLNF